MDARLEGITYYRGSAPNGQTVIIPVDRVAPEYACPACGECSTDYLANDDGVVTCATCGAVYDLEPERSAAEATA